MLTVFTPTYNRGYIIDKLYKSLQSQSNCDFEWLVVDDGSTDNTEDYFKNLNSQNHNFPIRYLRKINGGKHTAANLALDEAQGEIFFVVDSDDMLTPNAVERIYYYYNQIKDDESFAGVCGLKAFFNGKVIGSEIEYEILDTTIIDYRFYRKIGGDKADIFRTKLLKQHRFPEHIGEKWCPLSIVWNRFGSYLNIRYFNEVIYLAEYLEDGISLNRNKTRRNSPNNTKQYYLEVSKYNIPAKEQLKAAINFWRFGLYSAGSVVSDFKKLGLVKGAISFLPGLLLHYVDKKNLFSKKLEPKKDILKKQKL